ncbi:MAG: class I SAM-dependent methyltransferase [Deltaproteobacteria bacterium]
MNDSEELFKNKEYIELLYSEERRPKTTYPLKLAHHLHEKIYKKNAKLVDIGCGRGDMMHAFSATGYEVHGLDLSPASIELCKPHSVKIVDLSKEQLPYEEQTFEYSFSKSVIEHLHDPMLLLKENYRILKTEGVAIVMTPSWMHNNWGPFYLDHTHVTPFTIPSLRDAMKLAGFSEVKVYNFYQLPFLWKKPSLEVLIKMIAKLPLPYKPMYDVELPPKINTFIRFSKEVMLIATGKKK